jgi:predicted ATPase
VHLRRLEIQPSRFPTRDCYPFNLEVLQRTGSVTFPTPITFLVGENGTGKSTLLRAMATRCGIHIWEDTSGSRFVRNRHEGDLHRAIEVEWTDGSVPGAFFGSDSFRHFSKVLDEWAIGGAGILDYFGGKSLLTQSHGQSVLSYCRGRFQIRGLYLMDEPETALSPRSQLELLRVIGEMSQRGHAQFIIATHSPILMACPGAAILCFDRAPIAQIEYEETEHFRLYRDFMADRGRHLDALRR